MNKFPPQRNRKKSVKCQKKIQKKKGKKNWQQERKCTHIETLVIIDDITIIRTDATNGDDGTKNHMQNRHFSVSLAINRKSIQTNVSGKIIVCCSIWHYCKRMRCERTKAMHREAQYNGQKYIFKSNCCTIETQITTFESGNMFSMERNRENTVKHKSVSFCCCTFFLPNTISGMNTHHKKNGPTKKKSERERARTRNGKNVLSDWYYTFLLTILLILRFKYFEYFFLNQITISIWHFPTIFSFLNSVLSFNFSSCKMNVYVQSFPFQNKYKQLMLAKWLMSSLISLSLSYQVC